MDIGGHSSQVSDICPIEDVDAMLDQNPDLRSIVDSELPLQVDWSDVAVPAETLTNPTGELPDTTVYPGLHFFDVQIDSSGNHKKAYVISHILNKLFVDMNKVVPIKVKWDGSPGLSMRALMVFTQADSQRNPVRRCRTHSDEDSSINTNFEFREHVLACDNRDTRYEYDGESSRHSIVVPLVLQQGAEGAQLLLKFMCKTSCPGGLNRAPTDVIFTLEDSNRQVLGRQKFSVKICSCPKRDKEREEELIDPTCKKKKKTPSSCNSQLPAAKKIKTEYENGGVSFLVTASTPQVAENLKSIIRNYDTTVRSELFARTGANEPPILTITDHFTVLPPPYF